MAPPEPPSIDALMHTLATTFGLHARPTVLQSLLQPLLAAPRPPPEATLVHTLKFRLLALDVTAALQAHANLCLPPALPDHAPPALTLPAHPGIVVQVLDVVDLTSSRADALDRLEMAARGEDVRDVNDGLNTGAAAESDGGGGVGGMASEGGRDDGVGGSRTGGVGRGGRQVGGERAGREYVR